MKGAELEATWEPLPGLRFNFAGGWEDTALAKGSQAVDLMDRTAGNPDWIVVKPFVTQASNCILPAYVVAADLTAGRRQFAALPARLLRHAYDGMSIRSRDAALCAESDGDQLAAYRVTQYPGFDPVSVDPAAIPASIRCDRAPNNGEGFDKNLSGNKLPNAPPFTVSFGAQYTMPLTTGLGGHAARRLLLAGLFLGARVQRQSLRSPARLHQRQSDADLHQPERLAGDAL